MRSRFLPLVALTVVLALWAAPLLAGTIYVDMYDGSCVAGPQGSPYTVVYCSIQDAITDAAPGDLIQVAAGLYTEQITIDKSLDLIGAGELTTTIQAPASGRSTITEGTYAWDYVVAADGNGTSIDVKIQGFTIDANGQDGSGTLCLTGVFFRDVGDGIDDGLSSCTINNFGSYYGGWMGAPYDTYTGNTGVVAYGTCLLTIDDNDLDDYTVQGIAVRGAASQYTISANDLDGTDAGYGGMQVRDALATISANTISYPAATANDVIGIYLYDAANGVVVDNNNTISGNNIGLFLKGTNSAIIDGNTFTDNNYRSIVIQQDSDDNSVTDNTITMTGPDVMNAIYIGSLSSGNTIGGPAPADGNDITIPTNTSHAAHMPYVIHVATGGAYDNSFKNNTITNGARGIQIDGGNTGTYTITDNTITNDGTNSINMSYAVGVNAGNVVVTGNTMAGTRRPLECFGAGTVTFTGNTVSGINFFGLNLGSYTGNPVVTGNAFLDFGGNGNVVWNQGAGDVDATSNWWGDTDPSDNVNNSGAGTLDYSPWWGANYVGDDHSTSWTWHTDDSIQDAVDAADAGDVVNVADGTYAATTSNSTERPGYPGEWWFVTVDKSLDLIGESRDGVILDGTALQTETRCTGIWVSSSNVTVKNLTIQNFTQTPVTAACYGMYVAGEFRNNTWDDVPTLSHVTAENVRWTGNMYSPYFRKTEYATIKDCISENGLGDGIWIAWGSDYATVQGNTITNAGDHGMWVGGSWLGDGHGSNNVTITGNTINGAREGGISFVDSDGATIEGNTITNAAGDGYSVGALSLKDGVSNVTARYNLISGNDGSWGGYAGTGHGIGIDGTPSNIILNQNSVFDNAGDGCYNSSTVTVDATTNWWGDATGPGGVGPGSGDEVSSYVDYDPWIGKAGSENIVFDPDPEDLTATADSKTISVDYLGGGGGLVYGYNVSFTWDGAVVSTSDAQVLQGNLLSDQGATNFFVNQVGNVITVNAALEGAQPGVTGPGTMFTIRFDAVACGSSIIDLTVTAVRDNNNQPLGGFFADDGLIDVDIGLPVFTVNGPAAGECYATAPVLDLSASEACSGLDDAFYRIDGGAWLAEANLFTDYAGMTWDNASWTFPDFGTVAEGAHTVDFYCTDDFGNVSVTASWNFIKDTTAPSPVTGFASAPGHDKTHLSWTNPGSDFDHVVVVRKAWDGSSPFGYADYLQPAAGYPANPSDGVVVYSGTASSCDDDPVADRSIYFYHAFVYDCADNWTGGTAPTDPVPAAFAQGDRTTSYWLGDVAASGGGYDGYVNFSDISALSATYWLTDGDFGWNSECDVGPTDDWSRVGIPLPDDYVDFEDLIIFSMNIGVVDPSGKTTPPVLLAGEKNAASPTIRLEGAPAGKGLYEVRLILDGNDSEVKGASMELRFNEEILSFSSVVPSDALVKSRAFFIADRVARGLVKVDLAALGTDRTIEGSGELARVTFHAGDVNGELGLRLGDVVLRGAGNAKLSVSIDDIAFSQGATVPSVTRLVGAVPNPFNPTTAVAYELSAPEQVSVNIYDAQGRLVRTLVDQSQSAGHYEAVWNGRDNAGRACASGVYLVRMVAGDYGRTTKVVMLK